MTAVILASVGVGMLALSFAAVPLYRMFCQVTGYAGTTQRAAIAPDKVLDEKILIRFDSNTARNLKWRFQPQQRSVELRIGDEGLAFFEAKNLSDHTITGTATFNVTPELAGSYFNKIQCFCFTEQTLKPGESAQMPVVFFVDPDIRKDPDTKDIHEITLSYTFFEAEKQETAKPVASSGGAANKI